MPPIVDDLGADVALDGSAQRIVSLVPSLTEAVEVTSPGRIVGATDYCTHPPDLDVARVGGSKYPKLDQIRRLRPDLVLANSEENRPEDVEQLRTDGIAVWVMRAPETVPAALASLRRLLTDVIDVGPPRWLDEADDRWHTTRTPAQRCAVIPVWRKPWVVIGRDTFGGDVLHRLGVGNAYAGHADRYPRPKLDELRDTFTDGAADLLVLPDEPWEFTHDDGPDAFPDVPYVLVSGRDLTWYGPSLVAAHEALTAALAAPR